MAHALPDPLAASERDADVFTAGQAAGQLGFVSAQAVTALAAAGELPGTKVGGTWLFYGPALRAWQLERWPAIYERIAGPGVPVGPVLTAAELAARLGFKATQTVTDLAAAGVLRGCKAGNGWLFAWAGIYRQIAGPGVPDGPVLDAAGVARRLGLATRTVTDLAAAGVLRGCKVGNGWLFAWAGIYRQIAGPGVPDGPVLSAAELARVLGVPALAVRRAARRLGGVQIGKQWRFALEAARRAMAG
jgi:hypothetical protein